MLQKQQKESEEINMKAGVIGAGRIGKVHIKNISMYVPEVEIKTVADPFMNAETEEFVRKCGVTKVTKGGRTFSFSAIVVVGNEDGIIGWGLGKAGEVTAAIAKGVEAAKKNLTRVPVLKGTVPHEQSARFGGAEVFIKPASTGTGVVAGGAMRAVLESVGITDVLAKSKGSSNPHNLVKATILALGEMRDARMVAQNRGVSMEKVFRG